MLDIFKSKKLKESIIRINSRFLLSVILIFISSGIFISLIWIDYPTEIEAYLFRAVPSIIVIFFLSVGVYIFSESINLNKLKTALLQVLILIYGIFFYLGFRVYYDAYSFIFFIINVLGIISVLFIAPYIKNILLKKSKNKENKESKKEELNINNKIFYAYFYKISVIFLVSIILGLILFLLGNIAIVTVLELFDFTKYGNNSYEYWAVISLNIITPLFALSQIPSKEEYTTNSFKENIFFSFLTKYIAIPFIYLYFIILYLYSLKLAINFGDWPKGEVSWMVIGFSVFGYIIYLFSYTFEETNKFIEFYRKAFPIIIIPQIFILFYAIFLRINQYDLTINRYFIVIFGIWLLIISLYYIFSKVKDLKNIFIILSVFTLIISVGPWSVYNLPESRQLSLLEKNLIEANILNPETKQITYLENYSDISKELSISISSGINYLCKINDCKSIKELFSKEYQELEDKRLDTSYKYSYLGKGKVSLWEITEYITHTIKVKSYYKKENPTPLAIEFNMMNPGLVFPIDIDRYSRIHRIERSIGSAFDIDLNMKTLLVKNIDSNLNKEISIDFIFEKLYKLNKDNDLSPYLDKEELTFEIEGGKYKLIIENIRIKNPKYKGTNSIFTYIDGYLLER